MVVLVVVVVVVVIVEVVVVVAVVLVGMAAVYSYLLYDVSTICNCYCVSLNFRLKFFGKRNLTGGPSDATNCCALCQQALAPDTTKILAPTTKSLRK